MFRFEACCCLPCTHRPPGRRQRRRERTVGGIKGAWWEGVTLDAVDARLGLRVGFMFIFGPQVLSGSRGCHAEDNLAITSSSSDHSLMIN